MTLLDRILAAVARELAQRENSTSLEEVKAAARYAPEPRDGLAALRQGPGAVRVMAEIKRCSQRTPRQHSRPCASGPRLPRRGSRVNFVLN